MPGGGVRCLVPGGGGGDGWCLVPGGGGLLVSVDSDGWWRVLVPGGGVRCLVPGGGGGGWRRGGGNLMSGGGVLGGGILVNIGAFLTRALRGGGVVMWKVTFFGCRRDGPCSLGSNSSLSSQ